MPPIRPAGGDKKKPALLKIRPPGRVPAIVDRDNDYFAVFESRTKSLSLVSNVSQHGQHATVVVSEQLVLE